MSVNNEVVLYTMRLKGGKVEKVEMDGAVKLANGMIKIHRYADCVDTGTE